jgi:cadmium resistance protein CadD (predicted permease)
MSGAAASAAGIGVVVYASTNIDDLLILAVFFADPRVHVAAVVAGRFIGLAALVLASSAAALLALAIPPGWIALLGLVPLFLGLRALRALHASEDEDERAPANLHAKGRNGFAAQAFTVAGVTLANGGDNLGVYIPLFATAPAAIPVYVAAFSVMTLAWCALGYLLVNNPLVGDQVRRYGAVALPIVLIALGVYILSGAIALVR